MNKMFTNKDLELVFGLGGLQAPAQQKTVNRYPLTDIGYDEEENLIVNIAIAGFSKEDITIDLNGDRLFISGKQKEQSNTIRYNQKHISTKDFTRELVLYKDYITDDITAVEKNGILTIKIKPKKPQVVKHSIAIG